MYPSSANINIVFDFVFVFSSSSGARALSGWLSEFSLRLIKADDDYDDFL